MFSLVFITVYAYKQKFHVLQCLPHLKQY